ncbi:MAG TPA: TonB-dependent receptor [Pseudomonadales bacterium]|nr:TonB-dependent receptor [Pseudomonadales bacterium]
MSTKPPVLRPVSLRSTRAPATVPPAHLPDVSRAARQAFVLSVSALMAVPVLAADDETLELDTLQIEERAIDTNPYAEAGAPYKARVSGDERHVKPLAETPQTITVLTQTEIQDSGRSDLRAILATQPGITLGTGENGNAFGDRYIIRGHEARSDVFVDGLRDPGMTLRESFAVEQVEVTKGPSSTFAGRGSTGGAVNSITKQASSEYDFTKLQGGLGTDSYQRYTIDANKRISDSVAVRVNALYADQDVPDRSPANRERQGIALSAAFQINDRLRIVADYYRLEASDRPDMGTYIVPNGGRPVRDIPVYTQHGDFLESTVDTGTLRVKYDFSEDFRIQNAVRYGETDNGYVVTGARGATRAADDPVAPGVGTISLSTHQGWQEVEYFVDQLNVHLDRNIAGMRHQFLVSAEYSDLKVLNGNYNIGNNGIANCRLPGRAGGPSSAGFCILDGAGNRVGNIGNLIGRSVTRGAFDSDYNVKTWSASIMDTIDITEALSLFFGLRYDDFDYRNLVVTRNAETVYKYSDDLLNKHIGFVYQITPSGNVYATWSTSSEINGGESDVGASCGYGGLCGEPDQVTESKPEKAENFEIGSKWNLFDEKLLATVAVFQITKSDVMESVGDNYSTLGTLNTGKNRVKGIEISVSGNLTPRLSAQIGVSKMDSEVLKSVNPSLQGLVLSNFAEDSASVQLRYQVTDRLAIGGSSTYSSEKYAGQPDTGADLNASIGKYNYQVPSATTYDLFLNYEFNQKFSARLNALNITDKDYYLAAYRSGALTYKGDARSIFLTLSYEL